MLYLIVVLILFANVINIGADIGAMGSALKLVIGGSALFYAVGFGAISVLAAVFIPYHQYARVLKWSALVLLVYIATAFAIDVPWHRALIATVTPHITLSKSYMTSLTAVFGTTISPYLFFWQASQEVEEQEAAQGEMALKLAPDWLRCLCTGGNSILSFFECSAGGTHRLGRNRSVNVATNYPYF